VGGDYGDQNIIFANGGWQLAPGGWLPAAGYKLLATGNWLLVRKILFYLIIILEVLLLPFSSVIVTKYIQTLRLERSIELLSEVNFGAEYSCPTELYIFILTSLTSKGKSICNTLSTGFGYNFILSSHPSKDIPSIAVTIALVSITSTLLLFHLSSTSSTVSLISGSQSLYGIG